MNVKEGRTERILEVKNKGEKGRRVGEDREGK